MRLLLILLPACLFAQAGSPAVDLRRDSLATCAAAPITDVLEGADEWLHTYERNGQHHGLTEPTLHRELGQHAERAVHLHGPARDLRRNVRGPVFRQMSDQAE